MPKITTKIKKRKIGVIENLLEVSRGLKRKPLGAKMIIPTSGESSLDNLSWVLWQEYGVLHNFPIFPKNKKALSFPHSQGFVPDKRGKMLKSVGGITNLDVSKPNDIFSERAVVPSVIHPGFEAKHFIRDTLAEKRPDIKSFKAEIEGEIAVLGNTDKRFNPEKIGKILVKHLKEIKESIAQKMEVVLPQKRFDDGKLLGQEPADVFRRKVKIVKASGGEDKE